MARTMNKTQQKALKALYCRYLSGFKVIVKGDPEPRSYLKFRRTASYGHIVDCWMIYLWGMYIGIEKDGYTHS